MNSLFRARLFVVGLLFVSLLLCGSRVFGGEGDERLSLAAFKKDFPDGSKVPDTLVKLLKFQNQSTDWYSAQFELTDDGKATALAWCGKDKAAADQLVVFARAGADGSNFAFWMYKGRTLENAPIVFLDSDGDDNCIVADSLSDFLSLLAIGTDEPGHSFFSDTFTPSEKPAKGLDAFRAWLKKEFNIEPAANPKELTAKARKDHPDFKKWLDDSRKAQAGK